jgi:hypothetical protein
MARTSKGTRQDTSPFSSSASAKLGCVLQLFDRWYSLMGNLLLIQMPRGSDRGILCVFGNFSLAHGSCGPGRILCCAGILSQAARISFWHCPVQTPCKLGLHPCVDPPLDCITWTSLPLVQAPILLPVADHLDARILKNAGDPGASDFGWGGGKRARASHGGEPDKPISPVFYFVRITVSSRGPWSKMVVKATERDVQMGRKCLHESLKAFEQDLMACDVVGGTQVEHCGRHFAAPQAHKPGTSSQWAGAARAGH